MFFFFFAKSCSGRRALQGKKNVLPQICKDLFGWKGLEQELRLAEVAFASESRHKFVPNCYHFKKNLLSILETCLNFTAKPFET